MVRQSADRQPVFCFLKGVDNGNGTFHLLLDAERRAKLQRIAKRQNLSVGAFVRALIDAVAE